MNLQHSDEFVFFCKLENTLFHILSCGCAGPRRTKTSEVQTVYSQTCVSHSRIITVVNTTTFFSLVISNCEDKVLLHLNLLKEGGLLRHFNWIQNALWTYTVGQTVDPLLQTFFWIEASKSPVNWNRDNNLLDR